jgi:hypothetical protein
MSFLDKIDHGQYYIIFHLEISVHSATGLSRDTPQNKDLVGCPVFL